MGIDIDKTTPTPPADVGGDRNPNNQDTYEECDDNGNNANVQEEN